MSNEKGVDNGMEKIADLAFYTEGPAVDSEGNIYCTTLKGGAILRIDRSNNIQEWAHSPCPNGQIIIANDEHLVCEVSLGAIRRYDSHGIFIRNEIEGYCAGFPVHSPNDLVADSNLNIYFTDSIRHTGSVYFLGAGGEQRVVVAGLDYPNGLVLSADQKALYVAESYANRIISIDLEAPGIPKGSAAVFAELPRHPPGSKQYNLPDGLALDAEGNLWVAHYGMRAVHKLSPEGKWLRSVDTQMPLTSNLVFADSDTVIVTGGYGEPGPGALFRIRI